jgi:hypothetical protein
VANVHVGIRATGWAAGRHADALRRLPGVELAAVALVDAIVESHERGGWVAVAQPTEVSA